MGTVRKCSECGEVMYRQPSAELIMNRVTGEYTQEVNWICPKCGHTEAGETLSVDVPADFQPPGYFYGN